MSLKSRSNLLHLATVDGGLPYTKVMARGKTNFGLNNVDGGLHSSGVPAQKDIDF